MSQRQLAQQSGVDHSTISRLIRGDRMPSLGTATKLARGLRELRDDADAPQYLGLVSSGVTVNPTARVEYALRADEALGEPQVRQVMEYYLAVRMRRYARQLRPRPARAAGSPARRRSLPPRLPPSWACPRTGGVVHRPPGDHPAALVREAVTPNRRSSRESPSSPGSRGQRTPAYWGAGVRSFLPTGGGRPATVSAGSRGRS